MKGFSNAHSQSLNCSTATIDIFTDGGYFEKRNIGGWSWVIYNNAVECSRGQGSKKHTTSLEMELTAAKCALEYIHNKNTDNPCILESSNKITVNTDCRILIEGLQDKYPVWCANDWKAKSGKTVVFKELWQQLYTLSNQQNVEWKWVKGHSRSEGNNLADKLARQAVEIKS